MGIWGGDTPFAARGFDLTTLSPGGAIDPTPGTMYVLRADPDLLSAMISLHDAI
jgi:hypothetical protein